MWPSGYADRFALTIVSILVYGLRIDVWPDDWAASLVTNGRARFRHSPKSLNREAGHEGSCAESHVHTLDEGNSMITGTVKFYNDQKGFGFIQPDNGEKDVFVHATALERAGISGLREGQKVKFDTQNDPRSGKVAVSTIEAA
jgi:CspA family cold shock protein